LISVDTGSVTLDRPRQQKFALSGDCAESPYNVVSLKEGSDMTTFQAALTKEQGVTFVAVCVRDSVLNNWADADNLIRAMTLQFRCPAVLVGAQQHRVYGFRRDIVQFVANNWPRLPWREWKAA
jgi:hypothetical protein